MNVMVPHHRWRCDLFPLYIILHLHFHPIGDSGWSSLPAHPSLRWRLVSPLCWLIGLCSCATKSFLEITWFKEKENATITTFHKEKSKSMLSSAFSHRHYFCSFPIPIIKKGILSAKTCWLFCEFLEAKWPRHIQQIIMLDCSSFGQLHINTLRKITSFPREFETRKTGKILGSVKKLLIQL